jgi:hypothetical protein
MRDLSEPALVWTGKVMLDARVVMPAHPVAAVILASIPSLPDEARDVEIATALHRFHVATLYVPLLTEDEQQFDSRTTHFRHDAEFLGQRFLDVAPWLHRNRDMSSLPLGYAGSSGGAAGAIAAAELRPDLVSAVVSIDGRTDLAIEHLHSVKTPTLLIVRDMPVLRMNREAIAQLRGERRIEIIHDAGTEAIVEKTVHWFADKLALVSAGRVRALVPHDRPDRFAAEAATLALVPLRDDRPHAARARRGFDLREAFLRAAGHDRHLLAHSIIPL